MPTIISQGEEKERELHPPGLTQAVCVFVEDVGFQKTVYKGSEKVNRKVVIVWESEAKMKDGRPFLISKRYTASLFEKAQLRIDLESWRGRQFSQEELAAFDLDVVKGANAFINIVHETHNGKTYANMKGIAPLKGGIPKIAAVNTEVPKWILEMRAKAVTPEAERNERPPLPPDDVDPLSF
jgi:hypothetical protein